MFFKKEDTTEHHSGTNSYFYVEKLLTSSKELLIVSPYIDAYYAKFLLSNSRHRKIRVVSSSIDRDAERILHHKRHAPTFIIITLIVLLVAWAYYALGALTIASAGAALFVIIATGVLMLGPGNGIPLRKPKGFVHTKLYIGVSYAIEGSANLTYKGMHENTEHISVIRDEKTLSQLREEFYKLWNTAA